MLATDSTAASVAVGGSAVDAEVAAALTTTVDSWVADVALTEPERFVRALLAEFGAACESPCGASGVASLLEQTSNCNGSAEGAGAAGSSVGAPEVDCSAGDIAVGRSAGACAAGERRRQRTSRFWVGVASADAVVSLLDGAEPVRAPPEFCTTPERGSAVES